MSRPGPHHIGTKGAVDGYTLVYRRATDEYGPEPLPASGVAGVVQGTGVTVDNTDPAHPVISVPRREVLMASGVSFPADPLESSTGGDWLYGEAP